MTTLLYGRPPAVFDPPADAIQTSPLIPESAALEAMEQSKTLERYLGRRFCRGYVAVKRVEHENFKRVISSWEREFLLLTV